MTTTFIGGGKMGEAILSGMIAAGTHPNDIVVVEKLPERSADLARRHHVRVTGLEDGVAEADTVIIAVKPQGFDEALIAMRPHLRTGARQQSSRASPTSA